MGIVKSLAPKSLLIFFYSILVSIFYFWLKENGFFSVLINSHHHSMSTLSFYKDIYLSHNPFLIIKELFAPSYWPKLHYLFASLFLEMFGRSYVSMSMVNSFYLLILTVSIYGISFKISQNEWCALFSSIIVSVYPSIIWFMTSFELTIAVAAFVSLTIYFLILSESFQKTIYSILFAIFFCCSMYIDRFSPIFFIFGPYLLTFFSNQHYPKKRFLNLFLIHVIIFIILVPFYADWTKTYILNNNVFNEQGCNTLKEIINFKSPYFLQRLFFYILIIPQYHLGIFWFISFCFGLYILIKTKDKKCKILFAWLIFPFLLYTILPKKGVSYIMPALPPMAIITAVGFFKLKKSWLKKLLIYLCLVMGITGLVYFLFRPNEAQKIFCYRLNEGYRNDPTISFIGTPLRPFIYKSYYHWLSNSAIKYLPKQNDEKTQLLGLYQCEPEWWDVAFKVLIQLKDLNRIIYCPSPPRVPIEFCPDVSYSLVFQRMLGSNSSLKQALDDLKFESAKNNILSSTDHKIELFSTKLYFKKTFIEINQEILFYKCSK
jgi:hypothetical protein